MKHIFWLALLFLAACQAPPPALPKIDIIDGDEHIVHATESRLPAELLAEAGIFLQPLDRVLVNGLESDPNLAMDCEDCIIQIRRAVPIKLITPDGEHDFLSAAWTVGEALTEFGIQLYAADSVEPRVGTPVSAEMSIVYTPSRPLAIFVDGQVRQIRASAERVEDALMQGGIPLTGMDTSLPPASDPLPLDGQIRIIRVREEIELIQTEIPFEREYVPANDLDIDEQKVLTAGIPGLIVQRTRIRYEDGLEVARVVEDEYQAREPSTEIVGYGTQYTIKTAVVDGKEIRYWRSMQVYVTSYSPCNSGADRCYPNTASGKPVQRGVIGVIRSWYLEMQGQAVYVPGYGYATIEDVGGGIPGKDWIDLGYSDANYQAWHSWVTIYFLAP